MNDITIKAAEEFAKNSHFPPAGIEERAIKAFIAGAEHMKSQKEEQIREMSEGIKNGKLLMENMIEFYTSSKPQIGLEVYNGLIKKFEL